MAPVGFLGPLWHRQVLIMALVFMLPPELIFDPPFFLERENLESGLTDGLQDSMWYTKPLGDD